MLHASETWPLTKPSQRLQRNDRAMVGQICNVKQQDTATIGSNELLALKTWAQDYNHSLKLRNNHFELNFMRFYRLPNKMSQFQKLRISQNLSMKMSRTSVVLEFFILKFDPTAQC